MAATKIKEVLNETDKIAAATEGLEEGLDFLSYSTRFGKIVVRAPKLADVERFVDKVDGRGKVGHCRTLALSCRVYPEREEFMSIVDRLPLVVVKMAGDLQTLAGVDVEADAKKA